MTTVCQSTCGLQVRLGHASITEKMDTYGHLFPDAQDLPRRHISGFVRLSGSGGGRVGL
jgi:hypothetical protein